MPIIFFEFYKYGKNTELSRLKTGSRKYGWDTPPSAFRLISIFFRKYRNTDGTGFFPSIFILIYHACRSGATTGACMPWSLETIVQYALLTSTVLVLTVDSHQAP